MKIALALPIYGTANARFLYTLIKLVTFTENARIVWDGVEVRPQIIPLMISCSMLSESRNRLVVEAMKIDADYLLWMDADHVFPEDALVRLLSRSKLVVGCNYPRRFTPTSPTAAVVGSEGDDEETKENLVWTTQEKAEADEVEEVAHLGLGLCLMDMRILLGLEAMAKEQGKDHFWPLFHFEIMPSGISCFGEDVFFFRKLKEAGIKAYCDHALSWEVGHCHEVILTNAHAVAQKDRWIAWKEAKAEENRARLEEALADDAQALAAE